MEPAWKKRLEALEKRVGRLEQGKGYRAGGDRRPPPSRASMALRTLHMLQERVDTSRGVSAGALVYAGAARVAEGEYLYAREHTVADLLASDLGKAARLLSSLGNSIRLSLALKLLAAPQSSQELQAPLGEGTTGQLYHHLRDLQAAGLLIQPRRGVYRLSPQAAVPLLAILAACADLGRDDDSDPDECAGSEGGVR